MMKKFLITLAMLLGLATSAFAQAVQQSGSVTAGHAGCWATTGVLQDCGTVTTPRLNALGLYNGSSSPLGIVSTTVAGAPTGQYARLSFGVSTTAATISVLPFGGLGTVPLNININGTTYSIGSTNWLSGLIDSQIGSTQGMLLYRGASAWSALSPGSSGQVLQTLGAGANPLWAAGGGVGTVTLVATGTGLTGGPVTSSGTISLSTPVSVANGGTSTTTLTAHNVILGNGTSAPAFAAPGVAGTVLVSNGTTSDPTFQAVAGTGTVTSVACGTGLTGGTITTSGTCVVSDQQTLANVAETINALGSAGGTRTADLTLGNVISLTVASSANTLAFTNPPASGKSTSVTLVITNGGSQTFNWPANTRWASGTAPTLTTAGIDWVVLTTLNQGTNWNGFVAGLDVK